MAKEIKNLKGIARIYDDETRGFFFYPQIPKIPFSQNPIFPFSRFPEKPIKQIIIMKNFYI